MDDLRGPVRASVVYTADLFADAAGGIRTGARYLDDLDLQLAVDADRLVAWHGARIFLYGIYGNGAQLSGRLVGDVQGVDSLETGTRRPAFKVFEAWIEQSISDVGSIRFGVYNLQSEFDATRSGPSFIMSSHFVGPDLGLSGRNGPSIYPDASLAVRGEVRAGGGWVARLAVLDGVPNDPDHPRRTAIKLSGRDGALVIGEVDRIGESGKVGLGAWSYTARFADLAAPSGARTTRGDRGAYVFAERRLSGDRSRGVTGWLRLGVSDSRFNYVSGYVGSGLSWTGPFAGRPQDQTGIAVGSAALGSHYLRQERARGIATRDRETIVETTYTAPVTPWLRVQPDVQYVIAPSGDAALGNALVVGVRLKAGR